MNKRVRQHQKRTSRVILELDQRGLLWSMKSKMVICVNKIRADQIFIDYNHQIQLADLSGITASKNLIASNLEVSAMKVDGPLMAYLRSESKFEDLEKVRYTLSQFRMLPELDKYNVSNLIYNKVTPALETILISDWELADTDMPELLANKTNFHLALPKYTGARSERSVATKNILETDNHICKELLPELKDYMLMFRYTQTEFFDVIESAMKIDDPAYRKRKSVDKSTTIKGKVIDTESGLPLSNVKVYDEANPSKFTLTDANGNFTLTLTLAGTYTIIASLDGYFSDEETMDVELNFEYIVDDFELEKKVE